MNSAAAVPPFPTSLAGLPPLPPPALDPFIDAAARCFARYGIGRTSVQDVAAELGVNRTTVYRQVGNIEQQALLLAVRDAHRVISSLPGRIILPIGPHTVVDLIATLVQEARGHPVLAKVLADERELVGSFIARDGLVLVERVAAAFVPVITLAVRGGQLAPRDPELVAQWLVRTTASLILIDWPGDLHTFLAEMLVPALAP